MKTYLLTWNPDKSRWNDKLPYLMEEIERTGVVADSWRCMNKSAQPGDRAFLLKQGREPRGIVASGWVTSESFVDLHWSQEAPQGATADYVDVLFDVVLSGKDTDDIFERERLDAPLLAGVHWNTQASGILIHASQARQLEKEWSGFLKKKSIQQGCARPSTDMDGVVLPVLKEGGVKWSFKSTYERSPKARALCLKHHGFHCAVCNFDFGARYGDMGEGYIHVHHLAPLSQVVQEHEVDPTRDLRPVCPNCHAMLHTRTPPLSIEELKAALK